MNKNQLPVISIVTPSFNQGDFVEWTVRSVFEQRYPKLEYIFMDGGSTDSTLENIEKYRNRFTHFESGPDGGQSAAIAKGFEYSTGEIMAYLNSDDVLMPGTLNFVAAYFRDNPAVDLIYGHRCIVNEVNEVTGHMILPKHSNFLMRRWDLIPQESCFWRRSLLERAGNVDPAYRFAMDYDLFVRFMDAGKFQRVNRFLAAFRVHQDAKTSTQMSTIGLQEIGKIHKKYRIRLIPFLGGMFYYMVQLRSVLWLKRKGVFPGLRSGHGFDLNKMWG